VRNKIVIFGASGHAKSIAVILELLNYEILGFIDSFLPKGTKVLNYQTLGDESLLADCYNNFGTNQFVISVGSIEDREYVVKLLKQLNTEIEFPSIFSPLSNVAKYTEIGQGSFIHSNSLVNVECKIGDFCIINSSCTIEHNSIIGNFCNISPNAVVGAYVNIKPNTFIGASAIVLQKISIGQQSVIGAGHLVKMNIPDNVLAYGSPAEIKQTNYKSKDILN
jgi:sugar O-acyltransferase (sialic acid O-acetyltransferase NeuD family)